MSTTIIGAGYAGVMAANRLAGRGEAVTLVTPHPWFVERIRLHALAAGTRATARRELMSLLHPGISLVTDTATRIDDDSIRLASGNRLGYETLIYAVGSGVASSGGHRIASEAEALGLQKALHAQPDAIVTVVGAGLTGVELSGVLSEAGRRVRLVAGAEPVRRASRAHLDELRRRGVEVEYVRHDLSRTDRNGITVDATGFRVPSLAADSGLPVDAQGRLLVDATLAVRGHPRILGAGDAVRVEGANHLRPACATALPMGAHAADVIEARRHGAEPAAFDLGYLLQCVDLGEGRGHIQFVRPDDSERRPAITGRSGGLIKEAVCRMTIRWLTQEREHPGRYSWASGPAGSRIAALRAKDSAGVGATREVGQAST